MPQGNYEPLTDICNGIPIKGYEQNDPSSLRLQNLLPEFPPPFPSMQVIKVRKNTIFSGSSSCRYFVTMKYDALPLFITNLKINASSKKAFHHGFLLNVGNRWRDIFNRLFSDAKRRFLSGIRNRSTNRKVSLQIRPKGSICTVCKSYKDGLNAYQLALVSNPNLKPRTDFDGSWMSAHCRRKSQCSSLTFCSQVSW